MLHMWGVVGRGIGADILQLIFAEVTRRCFPVANLNLSRQGVSHRTTGKCGAGAEERPVAEEETVTALDNR